jgi:uncharacterized protein YraI
MSTKGKTTGNLKMRSGPGMEYEPPIAYLEPNTELEILEDLGDWLQVTAAGKKGYVGKKYVAILPPVAPAAPAPAGGMKRHDDDKPAAKPALGMMHNQEREEEEDTPKTKVSARMPKGDHDNAE